MEETDSRLDKPPARRRWPGVLPTLAAASFVALTVSLGNWQADRAAEKAALESEYDRRLADSPVRLADGTPGDLRFRRVIVRGEYDAARTIYIDNRIHRGTAGYHVVTPLRIPGAQRLLLVNRGWVPAGTRRDVLPEVPLPPGPQTVEGVAILPPEKVFELGRDPASGRVRLHLLPHRLAEEWKLPLEPFVLQQTSDAPDGLVREWERPGSGVDKHRAYSLQWYLFAALTVILYVFLGFRRPGRQ